jgi:hypothetical protein
LTRTKLLIRVQQSKLINLSLFNNIASAVVMRTFNNMRFIEPLKE